MYDEPMPGQCCGIRMKRSKVAATQITIVKADGLVPEDKSSSKLTQYIHYYWKKNSFKKLYNSKSIYICMSSTARHEPYSLDVVNNFMNGSV